MYDTFKAFQEAYLADHLRERLRYIEEQIRSLRQSELTEAEQKFSKETIAVPVLKFDNAYITHYEKDIPAEEHPQSFFFDRGESYPRQVVVYHVPMEGDTDMLKFAPSTNLLWTYDLEVKRQGEKDEVSFEIIVFTEDPEKFNQQYEQIKNNLTKQLENVSRDVNSYNDSLPTQVTDLISKRRSVLGKQDGFLSSLGVPVKDSQK
jgi:hypothetical protein